MRREGEGARGYTFLELALVLGIVGVLAAVGLSVHGLGEGLALRTAQDELCGVLEQGFLLARARGRNVVVAMDLPPVPPELPFQLPRGVSWGLPEGLPLPPGMDAPRRAHLTGKAHQRVTLTPRRTAMASLWFLRSGGQALCVRLNGHGGMRVLRWHPARRTWRPA